MAEETIDGAENLGNQNAQINQLAAQSDFLDPAKIEQPIDPTLKWQDNFANPTNFIKDGTAGISPNVPPSKINQLGQQGAMSPFASMIAKQQQTINSLTDYSNYAEPYAYDASPTGTFRDRHKAYGQETFNKIGFHPLIDNETWFNQNTTFGDDLSRWASHSAWPMFVKGVLDPIKSYKSIINGDGLFASDPEGARDYQYYNALAQSTKGGLGGFTVNLLNSASYSMGILTEGAMEGALIGSLFGGPGGAAAGATTGLRKLLNLPRGFANLARGTAKLLDDVSSYTNISKAKEYWKQAGTNFGNFANPLQNTFTALKNTNNLSNVARTTTTAGAFWHDVMAMNLALSEGKLEGGFTRNELYDKLYNAFVEKEQRAPDLEEQETLMLEASGGSWWNTHNNTALIYYTNKLVFPSITKASFLKGMPKFAFGKTVTTVGKEYQVLFEPGKKALEGQFVKQKINLVNAIKSLAKPSTYGKVGLNYFKANVMEGVQEVLQDVLQEATQHYYVETFKNPDARNIRYAAGVLGDAIAKQWSAQGFEVFMSGFLMGTILQAPGKIKTYATVGYNDYFKKDAKFKEYMDGREKMADDIVSELNTLYKNANFFFDPRISNHAQQGLMSKVIDNPEEHTTKEIRDTEFAAFQSALYASLERGTFNMFLEHYKKYEQASAKDIEEAWDLEPGQGEKALERFGKTLQEAEKTAHRYNTAKEKMKDLRIDLNNYEKDTEEYRMAQVYNKAFNLALNTYTFLHQSFDNNLGRINSLYQQFNSITSLGQTPMNDMSVLIDPQGLVREIEMLETEIESLESVTTQEAIAELTKKRELLELYTRYNENLEGAYKLFTSSELLKKKIEEIEQLDSDLKGKDEEVSLEVFKTILDEFEKGSTKNKQTFKESFQNLLVGLGETNQDRLNIQNKIDSLGGIDEMYDALLDTLILRNENSVLNSYVTLLASPNGFYEHIVRNFRFMKKLYNNREDLVKDIVNQEISAIERNSLLNTLADQGIYLDLEEFAKWVEDHNYYPEYFIDVKTNRMINKGSLLYEDYMDILRRAALLDEKKPAGEKLSLREKLDKKIEELNEERKLLIEKERDKYNKEFEDKFGMTPDEYEAEEAKRVAGETLNEDRRAELEADKKILEDALKTLQESTDAVEIQAAADIIADKIMKKDNIKGPEFLAQKELELQNNPERIKQAQELSLRFENITDPDIRVNTTFLALEYGDYAANKLSEIELELNKEPSKKTINVEETEPYIKFQEAVDQINEKYDRLIADVKADFEKEGVDEFTPKVYTTKTEFDDFDQEYQDEITKLFDEYLVETLEEDIELKDNDPIQYERLRKNWLEGQGELIKSINEKSKLKAEEKAKRLAEPPKLQFIDKQIGAENTTYEIAQIIKVFEKFLKDGSYPDKSGKQVKLTKANIEAIESDLAALKGYLKARVDVAAPRNIAEETVNLIQDNIINKQDELEPVYDEDGNQIGRKFKDSEALPERTTKVAEEVENDIKGTDPFIYQGLKDEVDKETGEILEKSPIEKLYDQIFNDDNVAPEDKVNAFMIAFEERVYRKGTKESPGYPAFAYPEKLAAIRNSLETDGSFKGLKEILKREAFRESSDAGNVVDDLIRIFLTPNASTKSNFSEFTYDSELEIKGKMTKISDVMSRKAFDKLFAPVSTESGGGIVTRFRLGIVDGSYIILSENVKLFDRTLRDNGITGEVDLILVKEDGTVAIVDIKTSTERKWQNFGKPDESKYEKSIYFRAQQSIYGYMFHNSTGITPELKLMPFSVTLDKTKKKRVGYIEDIELAGIVPTGQDTIDLEYLPEIEEFGVVKTEPENLVVRTKETTKSTPGYEGTDPSKLTLEDNIDKPVMYKGKVGKLIQMADGTFAIEVPTKVDLGTIQMTLDTLKLDKIAVQEYGSQEELDEINSMIERFEKAIESQQGLFEVYPIEKLGVKIVNEKLTLSDVGLQIMAPVENVGQVSVIQGEVIDASFSNAQETVASINGVRYDVLRNERGEITALSYMSNDAEISKIDKEIGQAGNKIGRLRSNFQNEKDEFKRNKILSRISELKSEIDSLNSRRRSLYDSNKKMYIYGSNADNYIFALNRLPNNFQRLTSKSNKLDEIQDLKEIDRLSLSAAISQSITEILAENYPEALDRLLEGNVKSPVYSTDLLKIDLWIKETIENLYQLGYTVLNRGDLTDDIQNQINALLDLQNDLELIKLTKDGKIKNFRKVQKIFTGEQKVQKRTRVPKNERTKSGKPEDVSGQSSREELKKIVKAARTQVDPTLSTESQPTKIETDIDKLVEKINSAKLNNIEKVYQDAVLNALKNKENTDVLKDAYNTRLEQLNTQMSLDTVSKGEYLILKNDIFDNQENTIFEIVRVNKQSVRLKNILSNEQITIKEEDLMNNFEKTTEEATQPIVEVEVDPVDIEGSNESKDVVKDLANDTESTNKFKEESRNSDVNSRFNDLKDNSKEC
jgi:hypothetical protein